MLSLQRRLRPTIQLLLGLSGLLAASVAWSDNAPRLRIEAAPGASQQVLPLAHPADVSSASLAAFLSALEYSESGLLGRSSRSAVFGPEEAKALAAELSAALARASSSQQVRFASFSRRSGTIGQLRKTEGVLFVDREQRINLAFAGIHEFAGADADFFAFLDLTDRNPLTVERNMVRLRSERGGRDDTGIEVVDGRPMWARGRLTAMADAPAPAAPAVEAPPITGMPAQDPATATRPAPAAVPVQPAVPAEAEVRQRLEFLKGLYEDGLITAEEYEQQRREALRRLD